MQNSNTVKVTLLGDVNVGKTSLIYRLCLNQEYTYENLTIGIDFRFYPTVTNGKDLRLQVWDMAGSQRFPSLYKSYLRNVKAVVLVYSVTERDSFDSIMQKWVGVIKQHVEWDVVKMIIANKCDLDDKRTTSTEEGKKFAEIHGFKYYETSAKTGKSVRQAFEEIREWIGILQQTKAVEGQVHLNQNSSGRRNCF